MPFLLVNSTRILQQLLALAWRTRAYFLGTAEPPLSWQASSGSGRTADSG